MVRLLSRSQPVKAFRSWVGKGRFLAAKCRFRTSLPTSVNITNTHPLNGQVTGHIAGSIHASKIFQTHDIVYFTMVFIAVKKADRKKDK